MTRGWDIRRIMECGEGLGAAEGGGIKAPPYIPIVRDRRVGLYAKGGRTDIGVGLTDTAIPRLPPAFLISQKSKIFDSY